MIRAAQLAQMAGALNRSQFARLIDHTLLKASATQHDLARLCEEACRFGFAAVSVNPVWVPFCAARLKGTPVGVDACVGFPLGANTAAVKQQEAAEAVANGATEIDMVINIGALRSGYADYVKKEIAAVVRAARNVPVKVILETGYLTIEEIVRVCEMSMETRAAYVKTSTGFGERGAAVEDVRIMRSVVGDQMGVKAAGGIRTYAAALSMIQAGANRIGTSAGIPILQEMPA